MDKGLLCFGSIVCVGIVLVLSSAFITALQDYTMIIVAVMFLVAGVSSTLIAGETLPRRMVILFIYFIVLVMNFFIPSGSAKAFLLIPLIVPAAKVFGISAQLCVAAFAFGDGFSNVFYPTNPVLLISLGLADVNYTDWVKWSWKFQLVNLLLTGALLLMGMLVGYC